MQQQQDCIQQHLEFVALTYRMGTRPCEASLVSKNASVSYRGFRGANKIVNASLMPVTQLVLPSTYMIGQQRSGCQLEVNRTL